MVWHRFAKPASARTRGFESHHLRQMNNHQHPACDCVIPFYNEGERISAVLKQLIKVGSITQIICVDGASTDNGAEIIKRNFPQVKLIQMKKSLGKTEAVKVGVEAANASYILFFDADLSNVVPEEVDQVIKTMFDHPEYAMTIFSRTTKRLITRLNRFDLIFSGERILKKDDILQILKNNPTKFQLEIAINKYMIDNHKPVFYYNASHMNLPKGAKLGFFAGIVEDLAMFKQVFSYSPLDYLTQAIFFCRKPLPVKK